MEIFRIRENFSSVFHSLDSIRNFDSIWRPILSGKFENKIQYKHHCKKLSDEVNCFEIIRDEDKFQIQTSYLIGLDFLRDDLPFMVEPKFSCNKKDFSVDFYSILFNSLPYVESHEVISDLYDVNFDKPTIEIEQKDDFLTPILVLQYIHVLKKICQSGLQKGYYNVTENLSGKVKGRIKVNDTLKKNHLKANFTKTICNYQEFGFNTIENQYLKFAFQFCLNYLNQFKKLDIFKSVENSIGTIRSAFEIVDANLNFRKSIQIRKNPLFPLYGNAVKLANLILKRSAFNITNTTTQKVKTYPYWINMSKLFELHVLMLLRQSFKNKSEVIYQKPFGGGRIPDIILNNRINKAVIDVKYKDYFYKSIEIEDVRQVAAYARMKGVFNTLELSAQDVLNAIIVYPHVESNNHLIDESVLSTKEELKDYYNIYKLDVSIPILKN